MVILCSQD